jgi:hypothetical protein
MGYDKTMDGWVKILFKRLSLISLNEGAEEEAHQAAVEILNAVYATGYEAGREEENIRARAQLLGQPHGSVYES